MWGVTFGGGRKVKEQRTLSPDDSRRQATSPAPQPQGIDWAAKRRQWNFKLLQSPAKVVNTSEKKESENEEFLPPQLSLMEYFLRKVTSSFLGKTAVLRRIAYTFSIILYFPAKRRSKKNIPF